MADAEAPLLRPEEAAPLAGVSDFRGLPVSRGGSGGWRSALFVVGTHALSHSWFGKQPS